MYRYAVPVPRGPSLNSLFFGGPSGSNSPQYRNPYAHMSESEILASMQRQKQRDREAWAQARAQEKMEAMIRNRDREKCLKQNLEDRETLFLTKWTPSSFYFDGKKSFTDDGILYKCESNEMQNLQFDIHYLSKNLERLIQINPERAKAIDWDEKIGLLIARKGGRKWDKFFGTLRQLLDDIIDNSVLGVHFPPPQTFSYVTRYIENHFGTYQDVKKLKKILLQQGAKPKTTSLTLQRKKKLTIPEDAPYVDWAKWGATIQDPRIKGGATRKRSKKSRKNMSRKRLH